MVGTYTSAQVCALAGVSYRCLDYWERVGRFGPPRGRGSGGDRRRRFAPHEVVLARAYVVLATVVRGRVSDERCAELAGEVLAAWVRDPALDGVRLIIEPGRAFVGYRTKAPAALIVNLASCARYVAQREAELAEEVA